MRLKHTLPLSLREWDPERVRVTQCVCEQQTEPLPPGFFHWVREWDAQSQPCAPKCHWVWQHQWHAIPFPLPQWLWDRQWYPEHDREWEWQLLKVHHTLLHGVPLQQCNEECHGDPVVIPLHLRLSEWDGEQERVCNPVLHLDPHPLLNPHTF